MFIKNFIFNEDVVLWACTEYKIYTQKQKLIRKAICFPTLSHTIKHRKGSCLVNITMQYELIRNTLLALCISDQNVGNVGRWITFIKEKNHYSLKCLCNSLFKHRRDFLAVCVPHPPLSFPGANPRCIKMCPSVQDLNKINIDFCSLRGFKK